MMKRIDNYGELAMFSARKLDRLVAAGIITQTQKLEILDYEDGKGSFSLIRKALAALGIFTVGLGLISLVAANWYDICDAVKLGFLLVAMFGTAAATCYLKSKGRHASAEKMLLGLFFLCGAGIGLVIQVFQLGGGKEYTPFGIWALMTLPLLFVPKQKMVSYFWVPLFLGWAFCYAADNLSGWLAEHPQIGHWVPEIILLLFLGLAGIGYGLERCVRGAAFGTILKKEAVFVFYLSLALYILVAGFDNYDGLCRLGRAVVLLLALSFVFWRYKNGQLLRRNVKFAGWLVMMLYINLGNTLGLFETGVGLIIGGSVLLLLLGCAPRAVQFACKGIKHV